MAEYTLYCFAQSGNAYKPALYLQLAGADWAPRFVDFFNGEGRGADFLAKNVMGEVPILEHGATSLTQSGVILDYLVSTIGRFGWNSEEERREILRWILFDNHKFTSYIATYRFLLNFAPKPAAPEVLEFLKGRVKVTAKVLAAHLAGRDFVVGDRLTIADLSLAGYVYFAPEYGIDWAADYPPIQAWAERIKAQPGWRHPYDLMPGHPLPGRS
ncbi:glutathione S-transferase family protein [Zavarzinia compransoris]|uniref:Glutathione S-transferase n=1 Tax=Zavarzinia compransoris TaxID=1264899 RepID=A0A317E0T6_9PROT|nr:glutathione S-transferase [Zavarzinia compransoris]PWR19730.1 glutathione S-transferase [Zavarzinia compransoris]TDP43322.1 glutathione S-transferase [Zavarzinia compransoris]